MTCAYVLLQMGRDETSVLVARPHPFYVSIATAAPALRKNQFGPKPLAKSLHFGSIATTCKDSRRTHILEQVYCCDKVSTVP